MLGGAAANGGGALALDEPCCCCWGGPKQKTYTLQEFYNNIITKQLSHGTKYIIENITVIYTIKQFARVQDK